MTSQPPHNAWLVPNGTVVNNGLDVSFADNIVEGDHLLLTKGTEIALFARIHRKRIGNGKMTLFFEAAAEPKRKTSLDDIGIPLTEGSGAKRLDWSLFISAMQKGCGFGHHGLKLLDDYAYLRRLLKTAVVDDLLGPANGPEEEIVGMSVRDRYLVGKLSPKTIEPSLEPMPERPDPDDQPEELVPLANPDHIKADKQEHSDTLIDTDDEETEDRNTVLNQSLVPSSIGLTLCIDSEATEIKVVASWGRYERTVSETETNPKNGNPARCWKRNPAGGTVRIPLKPGEIVPISVDPHSPEVVVQGKIYREFGKRQRLIALFLVNNQLKPETNQDAAWVFQPELLIRDPDGKAIFRKRPVHDVENEDDTERTALEMIYRNRVEFAVGHGISVHATRLPNDPLQAVEIRTAIVGDRHRSRSASGSANRRRRTRQIEVTSQSSRNVLANSLHRHPLN